MGSEMCIRDSALTADNELAGYDTAVAVAPSLSWLASTQEKSTGADNRRLAWISLQGSAFNTMSVVKSMLDETLIAHGIALDTSNELSDTFQGVHLAVVTAHGQLTAEERFIHRIVDEDALQVSPAALARSLAGVEFVVLFVCSGGRVDRHPMANTTVSLPKMLLNQGCRTVVVAARIDCAWPLVQGIHEALGFRKGRSGRLLPSERTHGVSTQCRAATDARHGRLR